MLTFDDNELGVVTEDKAAWLSLLLEPDGGPNAITFVGVLRLLKSGKQAVQFHVLCFMQHTDVILILNDTLLIEMKDLKFMA